MSEQIQLIDMVDWRGKTVKPEDKVKLRFPHPHEGRTGIYKGIERIRATGQWGCLVRFEDAGGGDGCYVRRADLWEKAS